MKGYKELQQLKGVGPVTAKALAAAGFTSLTGVAGAEPNELYVTLSRREVRVSVSPEDLIDQAKALVRDKEPQVPAPGTGRKRTLNLKLTGWLMGVAVTAVLLDLAWLPASIDTQAVRQLAGPARPVISAPRAGTEGIAPRDSATLDSRNSNSIQDIELIERTLRYYSDDLELIHRIAVSLVREANAVMVSPHLLLGIMLAENPWLDPQIESSVGAKGLMQVMPFHAGSWPPCGDDLGDVDDNICNGARIFARYYRLSRRNLKIALLRYNGCVTGSNTPDCYRYPHIVISRMPAASD